MLRACLQGLSALSIGGKPLTVRRACASGDSEVALQALIAHQQALLLQGGKPGEGLQVGQQAAALSPPSAAAAGTGVCAGQPGGNTAGSSESPSGLDPALAGTRAGGVTGATAAAAGQRVVRLSNMVSHEDLVDDAEYQVISCPWLSLP